MRKGMGRWLANPIVAVFLCAAASAGIWLVSHQGDEAPNPRGPAPAAAAAARRQDPAGRPGDASVPIKPDRDGTTKSRVERSRRMRDLLAARQKAAEKAAEAAINAEFDAPGKPEAPAGVPDNARPDSMLANNSANEPKAPVDPRSDVLAEYDSRRGAAAENVDAQKDLATWCDAHGLWEQAQRHWEAVIQLNPSNDAARKRLGYKRMRDGSWNVDAKLAEQATQNKADTFWNKELSAHHRRMHAKSSNAASMKSAAVAKVEGVQDARAVPSLWRVFAGDHRHHGLTGEVLARIRSPQSSQMLAALAVYSLDEKARAGAIRALGDRDPAEFSDPLVKLMNVPLRYQVHEVPDPDGGRARVLFIEGDRANYELLYPATPTPGAFCGVSIPGVSMPFNTRTAQQFNQNQARMAKAFADQQIESDKAAVEALNGGILAMNERVSSVLNRACAVNLAPDPAQWRRWSDRLHGRTEDPASSLSKPTISQVVLPLFQPTFVPAPAPT